MSRNLLDQETSLYLLQHKDNPVHWRSWNPETLAEAERADKPILVSIGYSACHWCHVMAEESFEDAETAKLMNELYVCVKVDREERPDVDYLFQTMLSALGQPGGWPTTIFLTPKGEPIWGGTYFPKEASASYPAFKTVLNEIAQRMRDDATTIEQNAVQLTQALDRVWNRDRGASLNGTVLDQAAVRIGQRYDLFFGGLTGAPKFPNVTSLELLWRAYMRSGAQQCLLLACTTLDHMCQGGIYDHLGGGFSRYSTDERWLVPHFEKMLYDNALMLDILTLVWQHGRQPLYRQRIDETIAWVLREMLAEGGAFASSLDADSEGEEGKFYLWAEPEIDATLAGTFVQRFKQVYGVAAQGNHQGKNILNRLNSVVLLADADEALLAKQRQLLFEAREQRPHPMRDDKILTDWNGLMIAALANAGAVFRRSDWTAAAIRAYQFIRDKLGDGDRLFHTYREKKRQHPGFAEDYANMARAALALWETAGDRDALEHAEAWTRVLNEHFWDSAYGGYCLTADDGEPAKIRIRSAFDSQTPSANGTMVEVLGRLHFITGKQEYRERSNALLQAFAGEANNNFLTMASYLNGFEFVAAALQIVIVGPLVDARTHALVQAVRGRSLPNRLLMVVQPSEALPQGHPAFGKTMVNSQPTAYICYRNSCSEPITSPVTLAQVLLLQPVPAGLTATRPAAANS